MNFFKLRFSHVVSLGHTCSPAFHIRRVFNVEKAFPFDWVIAPERGLRQVLANPCDDFVNKGALQLTQTTNEEGFLSVVDTSTSFEYLHDFRSLVNWEEEAERVAAKYRFLARRWQDTMAAGGRILFVRDVTSDEEAAPDFVEPLHGFLQALYPKVDVYLLGIQEAGMPGARNGRRARTIDFHGTEPWSWHGSFEEWEGCLRDAQTRRFWRGPTPFRAG